VKGNFSFLDQKGKDKKARKTAEKAEPKDMRKK